MEPKKGRVLSVNVSEKRGQIKRNINEVYIKENYGMEPDAHSGDWHRQVSLLSLSSFDKMRAMGAGELEYGVFAENITVDGMDVAALPLQTQLQVGEAILEVTQIGKECHNHGCAIKKQVGTCVMPLEGIFAKVLHSGWVRVGDSVELLPQDRKGSAMSEMDKYTQREIIVYKQGRTEAREASVVLEKPLTLFLNHVELTTMICSPGGYEELGIGFLISEGLVQKRSDIVSISCREEEGLLWIETSQPVPQTNNFLRRHIASCCGKGRAGLYFINDFRQLKAVQSDACFSAEQLLGFINALENRSDIFRLTGGVHGAALADQSGLLFMYEDIGRHNAVDKILGKAFWEEMNTSDKCLILSGRIASEILIKAARSNIAFVLSRSAPTELTIELAEELDITVVGFARGDSFNVYSHPEKVIM